MKNYLPPSLVLPHLLSGLIYAPTIYNRPYTKETTPETEAKFAANAKIAEQERIAKSAAKRARQKANRQPKI